MIECCEALTWLRKQPDDSIDLVMGSPPYEDARTYGLDGVPLVGEAWVAWMVDIFKESARVCKGLVCYVVEGRTRKFRWSATPALLMADLHRAGLSLRKPPIFHRVGIPGSGGPDWWRNDWEACVCISKGRLPWSDNTANGHTPIYPPGGAMSNRVANGERVDGFATKAMKDGDLVTQKKYRSPAKSNAGNIIHCSVGGGRMGHPLAHENEAPYPESLVEPFIKCFCPPQGLVADPFMGSGTTAAVALKLGRRYTGCDLRQSQVELTQRRLADVESAGKVGDSVDSLVTRDSITH